MEKVGPARGRVEARRRARPGAPRRRRRGGLHPHARRHHRAACPRSSRPRSRCRSRSGRARRRGDRAARRRAAAPVPGHGVADRLRAAPRLIAAPFCSTCCTLDGEDLLDAPGAERAAALAASCPEALRVPRVVTDDAGRAQASSTTRWRRATRACREVAGRALRRRPPRRRLAEGQAGATRSTSSCWPPSGATAAAAAGSATCTSARATTRAGGFVMLGKTFKGLTDEMLDLADRAPAGAGRRARRLGRPRPPRARRRDRLRRRADAARATPAAWRCASRASCATGRTSAPRRPTRSPRCWRSGGLALVPANVNGGWVGGGAERPGLTSVTFKTGMRHRGDIRRLAAARSRLLPSRR